MLHTPYTYLIGWPALNKWYYGVRTAITSFCLYENGCHPDELFVTYFTSSKYVKDFITKNGPPDIIQIRKIFVNDMTAAKRWESTVIRRMRCMESDIWLNRGNAAGEYIMDDAVKVKRKLAIQKALSGKSRPKEVRNKIRNSHLGKSLSDSHRKKLSEWQKGKPKIPCSEQTKRKISEKTKGLKRSEETKEKMSKAKTNISLWPNGRSEKDILKIKQTWENKPLIECPYCGLQSKNMSSLSRWHFNNCKYKKDNETR
jgi:hypothetical protein